MSAQSASARAELPAPTLALDAAALNLLTATALTRPAVSDRAARDLLAAAAARPEITALQTGLNFQLGKPGALPLLIDPWTNTCAVAPEGLGHQPAATALLRHAAEVMVWKRAGLAAGAVEDTALAMLASRAAGLALNTYPLIERLGAIAHVPVWLATSWRLFAGSGRSDEAWRMLATDLGSRTFLPLLLRLQGYDEADARGIAASAAIRKQAHARFTALQELAAPAEWTLAAGGDPRITIDPETGRNGYGSATRPIPEEISLSSSTATTVTPDAFAAAETGRQALIAAAVGDALPAAFDDHLAEVRAFLRDRTGARAAVLTASGTDTALLALAVAMAGHDRPVTSIVLAPAETGSGIPLAAAGRHFLGRTAHGHAVEPGAILDGFGDPFSGERVRTRTVPIRAQDGTPLAPESIDASIAEAVASEIAQGRSVLVHALASSKTGMGAPGPAVLTRLQQRYGNQVHLVVDACQLRAGPGAVRSWLATGAMVQITGSKFLAGPPFSGALLLPAAAVEALVAAGPLPAGLSLYCARPEWDEALAGPAAALPDVRNLGLLARWQAALATWKEMELLSPADCETALATFGRTVITALASRTRLELVESPLAGLPDDADDVHPCARRATIYPIRINAPAGGWLELAACKRLHQALQRDLASADDPAALASILRRPVAFGQPVQIGSDGGAALRICANAATLGHLATGGPTAASRLAADLTVALDKLEAILARGLEG